MIILLAPIGNIEPLEVSKQGDTLLVNGEFFDLSLVGEGDTLPREAIRSVWFAGPVDRVDGELVVTLLLPLPGNFSPEQAFPVPLENVPDGPVALPQPLSEEAYAAKMAAESEASQ